MGKQSRAQQGNASRVMKNATRPATDFETDACFPICIAVVFFVVALFVMSRLN